MTVGYNARKASTAPIPIATSTRGSTRTGLAAARGTAGATAMDVSPLRSALEDHAELLAKPRQLLFVEVLHQDDPQLVGVLDRRVHARQQDELSGAGEGEEAEFGREHVDEQTGGVRMRRLRADGDVVRFGQRRIQS